MKIHINAILWIFLVLLLAISVYTFKFVRSEGAVCMADPLTYAINHSDPDMSCSCRFPDRPSRIPFDIDKEGIRPSILGSQSNSKLSLE